MKTGIDQKVHCFVAGAAPPAAVIEGMELMGFDITHVYGLTETYGPAAVCAKHEEWDALDIGARTERNGRQGVRYTVEEGMTVMDPETMTEVPWDGETMGEIMFRGNITMKGYLKNPTATEEAFAGGWFHSGDLAVMQPDGYVKIKDRSKDIIISGGENISSLEVEDALYRHPAVLAAAVVAQPDPKWGETPCAFVELKPGAATTEDEIIAHCREHLARFKAPKRVIFGELPKTSTGKIQKFLLREQGQIGEGHRYEHERARSAKRSPVNAPVESGLAPLVLAASSDGVCTLTLNRGDRFNALSRDMIGALEAELDRIAADTADARRRAGRERPRVLRGPRPEGDARAPRCRLAARAVRRVQPDDAEADAPAATGDRARARPRHGGGLPARFDVRPGGGGRHRASSRCRASTSACSARRPRSGVGAQHRAEARHGDAADRRADRRRHRARLGPRQPGRGRWPSSMPRWPGSPASSGRKSASVVALGKRAFYEQIERGLPDAYALTGEAMACNLLDPDAAEGIDAFVGKRPPNWQAGLTFDRR